MDAAQRRDEDAFYEIEAVMLYVSEALDRARKAQNEMRRIPAEPHLIESMAETERAMKAEIRRIRQTTHFAPPRA